MNTINNEGVIYTRVSSLKQVTQGSGLDSQYSEDDVIRFKLQGKSLLSHPEKSWQQADSNMKKIIFNFIFEENLKVKMAKLETPNIAYLIGF